MLIAGQSPFSYASRISQFGNRSMSGYRNWFCGLNEAHVRERYTCIYIVICVIVVNGALKHIVGKFSKMEINYLYLEFSYV